ncbi:MAG: hypothetical protein IT530_13085 [Burkholderiales bacterium]|nr:hypothetical protein [Burkholderiales bacterium]
MLARRRSSLCAGRKQKGLVLAVILIVLASTMVAAILAFASPAATSADRDKFTQDAFLQARAALISRAARDANRPGSLPCPDIDNDGIAEIFTGADCPSYVGRLPWQTLGLPDLRDSTGERLWYALSPAMRDAYAGAPALNSDTPGSIVVAGPTPASDVVAVVISPGAALIGQNRSANVNNAAYYLEDENNNGDDAYVTAPASSTFNDRLLVITREQLFHAVEWRVANEIRATLEKYYGSNGYLPFANDPSSAGVACTEGLLSGRIPNPDSSTGTTIDCSGHANWDSGLGRAPPTWFFANQWHLLTYYALAPACALPSVGCTGSGWLTVNGVGGKRGVVIVGSRVLSVQTPPCIGSICIEQPSAGANQYRRAGLSTTFNDKLAVIP